MPSNNHELTHNSHITHNKNIFFELTADKHLFYNLFQSSLQQSVLNFLRNYHFDFFPSLTSRW